MTKMQQPQANESGSELIDELYRLSVDIGQKSSQLNAHLLRFRNSPARLRDLHFDGAAAEQPADDPEAIVDFARRYLTARQRRPSIFGDALFSDPAWDILLDLFVADADRRRVYVTDSCIASMVPKSTALRWIHCLELQGLVRRTGDHDDARRIRLELTGKAREKIADWAALLLGR